MKRLTLGALAGGLAIGMLFTIPDTSSAQRESPLSPALSRIHPDTTSAQLQTPPGAPYKKVSSLVPLPDFVPGLGTLYVDPATLPAGPFLAYDHQGHLVSSIYMIPLKDMNALHDYVDEGPVGKRRLPVLTKSEDEDEDGESKTDDGDDDFDVDEFASDALGE